MKFLKADAQTAKEICQFCADVSEVPAVFFFEVKSTGNQVLGLGCGVTKNTFSLYRKPSTVLALRTAFFEQACQDGAFVK